MSEVGVGVVLTQISPHDKKLHLCAHYSQHLCPQSRTVKSAAVS